MARRIAVVCVWLGLVSPAAVHALGLGDIHVRSALNQPLDAEIELISAAPGELEDLEVALAPRETFERYGIDRPSFLSGLEFDVARGTRGEGVLRVSSAGPVSEPFLTFLIEAKWPRGRLLREYTVLLDPPVYLPDEGRAAPAPARAEPEPEPEARVSGPITRPAAPAESSRRAPPPAAAEPEPDGEYGPVVRNETLWTIADRLRGDSGATINQMMIALYRANPAAFNGNINLLHAGAVLRVPDATAVEALQISEATAEVARQNTEWEGGRQTVAARPAAAVESPAARLRLVAPDEEDSGTAPTGAGTGPAEADVEAEALRQQVTELQAQLEETQRLIEVKDSELAAMQARLAEQEPAGAGSEPQGSPGVDLEAETGAGPAAEAPAAAAPRPATIRDSGGMLDGVMALLGSTWLYVGLGIALLLATLLIFARRRREPAQTVGRWQAPDADDERGPQASVARTQRVRTLPEEDESIVVVEQRARGRGTAAGPAPAPEQEPQAADEEDTLSSATAIHLDQADPLAEADFHMAYGLYDQAAELVRKAADREPARRDLRMKLLEIYFVWGNEQGFLEEARELHDSMEGSLDADWDKTLIMGKQICPDEPLFAGEPGGGGQGVDLDLADSGTGIVDFVTEGEEATALDLDLGEDDEGQGIGDTLKVAPEGALDFDFAEDDTAETRRRSRTEGSTIETSGFESPTVETPTLEQPAPESPTVESPTLESAQYEDSTVETPTIEQRIAAARESSGASDQTAEIDLDDLGLDLEDLRDETLGGTLDDDATMLAGAPDFESRRDDEEAGTEDLEEERAPAARGSAAGDRDATAEVPHFGTSGGRDLDMTSELESLDIDLEDLSAALDAGDTAARPGPPGGDTVRQPRYRSSRRRDPDDLLDADLTEILTEDDAAHTATRDLDLGDIGDSDVESEVGTKLDLARAYMDMGDPEGAQSILQEVLEEGDTSQREEAQRLMKALP